MVALYGDLDCRCGHACNMLLDLIPGSIAEGTWNGNAHFFFLVDGEDGELIVIDPTVEQFGEETAYVGPMTEAYEIQTILGGKVDL